MTVYGLFSTNPNRFYFVSADHNLVKRMQLIMMPQRLFLLVDLTSVGNYTPVLFHADNFLDVGITNGELVKLQVDIEFTGEPNRFTRAAPVADWEKVVVKNIKDLATIVRCYIDHQSEVHNYINNRVSHLIQGMTSFKDIMSPGFQDPDPFCRVIDAEIQDLSNTKRSYDATFIDLQKSISDIALTDAHWQSKVIDCISKMPNKNRHLTGFKQKIA